MGFFDFGVLLADERRGESEFEPFEKF